MLYIICGLASAFVLAFVLAQQMGHKPHTILRMAALGAREAITVAVVLLFIGMVTGIWRSSGTIVEFVILGVSLIRPSLFLIVAFLTACLLSYALGTSFGVAGTVGVIFMTLARSGGVDPVITGGVLLSGVFFGDRSSPAASTATMVSHLTGTDLIGNVKRMAVSGILPFALCLAVYTVLSFKNPIGTVDAGILNRFQSVFSISPWTLAPAVFLLILPLLRIPILWCMTASIFAGVLVTRFLQGMQWSDIIRTLLLGYTCPEESLQAILDGGGMKSMFGSCAIITLACGTSGIFQQAGMLHHLQSVIRNTAEKVSTFPLMILTSLCASAIFCNQVIAILMCTTLFTDVFQSMGRTKEALALDIENICITVPAFIPWSIICAVPLELLGTDYRSMLFAVYLYAVPMINWFYRAKKGYAAKV